MVIFTVGVLTSLLIISSGPPSIDLKLLRTKCRVQGSKQGGSLHTAGLNQPIEATSQCTIADS